MVGCYGGSSDEAEEGGSGDDDDDDGDGDDDDDDDDEPPYGECGENVGFVGLQRLTRAEYNRTVRDLFGVESDPADVFPPDSVSEGFDNNADSLTISPQLTTLLLDTAETVAAIAMLKQGDTIVSCDPASSSTCAEDIMRDLALRVYRRPPSDEEVDGLVVLVAAALDEGEAFEDAIEYALSGMLVAPQFLYRNVPAPGIAPLEDGEVVALDDYAVASRLSYFLWGSTPDDALLAAAEAGELTDSDGLRAQFDRMLADDKAEALYDSFAAQWLQLGRLGTAWPDPMLYPEFDDAVRDSMVEEVRRFFVDLIERDGSAIEIVRSTTTFANADIAAIYGVSGPTGDAFEPITVDDTERAGILTMPGVLTMLSDPDAPNIVRRGVWIAETMLCAAPPPPPEGIEPSPPPEPGQTQRELLEQHRADPNCASCHSLIDPLGFALENYDALGYYRTTDENGDPVDNLGELPDGTTVNGAVELSLELAEGDMYKTCVARKLMTYSLGRTMTPDDQCAVDQIALDGVVEDASLSDLLWLVVTSDPFLAQRIDGGL